MGVGADDGAGQAVEVPAKGHLLGSGLGVEIDYDDGRYLPGFADELHSDDERAVETVHEDAAYEVHYGDFDAGGALIDAAARPWRTLGVIGRPQKPFFGAEVLVDLFFVPDVVSGGYHIYLELFELLGDVRGDSEAARGVLAVGDDKIRAVTADKPGKKLSYSYPPRLADDISYE